MQIFVNIFKRMIIITFETILPSSQVKNIQNLLFTDIFPIIKYKYTNFREQNLLDLNLVYFEVQWNHYATHANVEDIQALYAH